EIDRPGSRESPTELADGLRDPARRVEPRPIGVPSIDDHEENGLRSEERLHYGPNVTAKEYRELDLVRAPGAVGVLRAGAGVEVKQERLRAALAAPGVELIAVGDDARVARVVDTTLLENPQEIAAPGELAQISRRHLLAGAGRAQHPKIGMNIPE